MSTPQFAPFDAEQSQKLDDAQAISTISKINPQWGQFVQQAAKQYNMPASYIVDTIQRESSFNPAAHGLGSTATGLGQFTHNTAQAMGINPQDPQSSIMGVGKYLAYLRDSQGVPGDLKNLTEAYILGPQGYRTFQAGGSPTGVNQLPSALSFLEKHGVPDAGMSISSAPPKIQQSLLSSIGNEEPQQSQLNMSQTPNEQSDDVSEADTLAHKLAQEIMQEEEQS